MFAPRTMIALLVANIVLFCFAHVPISAAPQGGPIILPIPIRVSAYSEEGCIGAGESIWQDQPMTKRDSSSDQFEFHLFKPKPPIPPRARAP